MTNSNYQKEKTMKPIDVGPGYDRLAEAMYAEGVHQVRFYRTASAYTVEMFDGRTGQGPTIRAAIESANHERLAA